MFNAKKLYADVYDIYYLFWILNSIIEQEHIESDDDLALITLSSVTQQKINKLRLELLSQIHL